MCVYACCVYLIFIILSVFRTLSLLLLHTGLLDYYSFRYCCCCCLVLQDCVCVLFLVRFLRYIKNTRFFFFPVSLFLSSANVLYNKKKILHRKECAYIKSTASHSFFSLLVMKMKQKNSHKNMKNRWSKMIRLYKIALQVLRI